RAIETAVDQESIEKKALRARGKPEHHHQQSDQQEDLNETEGHARQRRIPSQRNTRGINRADGKKDEHRQAQNGRDNRNKIAVDLESSKKTADGVALQGPCHQNSSA